MSGALEEYISSLAECEVIYKIPTLNSNGEDRLVWHLPGMVSTACEVVESSNHASSSNGSRLEYGI